MSKRLFARDKQPTANPTNLTHSLTSFIGRKKELAQVHHLLTQTHMLTLTGVGGCGKTRLAQQVARELVFSPSYPDGVWFVELATIHEPDFVLLAVAQTLKVREVFNQSVLDSLTNYLAERQLLLVLDNCEHLLPACVELAEKLILASSQLKILATSREPLGLPGETTYLVPSLSMPDHSHAPLISNLGEYDALTLFVERARAVIPSFVGTEQNIGAILHVCRRLDGIPLAIELAAARVNVLTVEQIATRLDDRFNLLMSSNRAAVLPRHQTLREAIDWSYELLSEEERTLFRRLAVFAGGFTLVAVEEICSDAHLEGNEILDTLARLVSKSLVVAQILEQREARYHLLETIRQYALHLLHESGEENQLRDRHLAWFLAFAEEIRAQWRGPRQKELFDQLEIEHDNLRAALEWSKQNSDAAKNGLRLGSALWRFWEIHNHLREGRQHLAELLALPDAQLPSVARATALYGAGYLAMIQGGLKNFTAAEILIEESLAIARELNEPRLIAYGIYGLGIIARFRGDLERAVEQLEKSLALFRQLDERVGIYISLYNLAEAATARGEYEQAQKLHEESLTGKRDQGDEWSIANSLMSLAILARLHSNFQHAVDLLQEGLGLFLKIGDTTNVAFCLLEFSTIAAIQGQSQMAIKLYAFADQLLEALGYSSDHEYRRESERQLASIRLRMGETRFKVILETGNELTLDQALELVHGLASSENGTGTQALTGYPEKDQTLSMSLNERELEILHLIAEGLSNHEIAERLVIALSTVKWHINNLFGKLSVRSRTQAVAKAKELGLL